jgi:hypothetical protein
VGRASRRLMLAGRRQADTTSMQGFRPKRRRSPPGRRRCSRCAQLLPLDRFNRLGDGHQWWCRECFREYFRQRGDVHRNQTHDARRRRQREARRFVTSYLSTHPCVDCGERDLSVLEFDHLGEKRDSVSLLVAQGVSLKALRREIAGCAVVCVNCHRRRTARRANWRRANSDWRSALGTLVPTIARNLEFAYRALERSGCVDCGLRDLCVLEFDHVSTKHGNVTTLAHDGCSLERLATEIAACEVRCANCHRRRTVRERTTGISAPKL